jgi:hypothetical protein
MGNMMMMTCIPSNEAAAAAVREQTMQCGRHAAGRCYGLMGNMMMMMMPLDDPRHTTAA